MKVDGEICYKDENGNWTPVGGENTPVSMNMWGFTPDYFAYSEEFFKTFLSNPKNMENLKSEFFIPLMVDKLINDGPLLFFKDYAEMKQWTEQNLKDEFQNTDKPEQTEVHEQEKNLVAFVSPETGFLVLPGGACCIRHPNNPYYQAEEAGPYAIKILFDPHYSAPEMVRCLVRENLLPDAALFSEISVERGKQLLQDDLDFLLRVIRPDF